MISKLHLSLSLVVSYLIFYYLLYFDKISAIILSLIVAAFSSIPDFDWKIYSWSSRQLVLLNRNKLLKLLVFPYYIFILSLNKIFRHRTLTHSLFFIIVLILLGHFLFPVFYLMALAVLLHIVEDMFTVSGVPLFYPISRKTYKIPIINTKKHTREQKIAAYILCILFIILLIL
ncbi:MAG TPA: metal-dependent hydrolase [Candidatus Nanopusillus sp.]|nr:metal-dependent hydrolase [Candidatus Nanopusillus sp.]